MTGPLDGFRPPAPPPELRARVLVAARGAAESPAPTVLDLLIADHAVRAALAAVCLLLVLDVLVDSSASSPTDAPARAAPVRDEGSLPNESGLTAAEQIDELEPAL